MGRLVHTRALRRRDLEDVVDLVRTVLEKLGRVCEHECASKHLVHVLDDIFEMLTGGVTWPDIALMLGDAYGIPILLTA